jgi:hypothetical protein
MAGETEQFLKAQQARETRYRLPPKQSAVCDQLQAVLRDLWLTVGLTNVTDQARGALVVVGLMVERAKALGLNSDAVEYCAQEIRLAVADLVNAEPFEEECFD